MRGVSILIWGDLACFTRPEMKVERVSYDVSLLHPRPGASSKQFTGNPKYAG